MSAAPSIGSSISVLIEVIGGPNKGAKFVFDKSSITVGRGAENDIILASDSKISRLHMELRVEGDFLYAVNLSQKNFILIGDKEVNHEKLSEDTKISLGQSILRIQYRIISSSHVAEPVIKPVPPPVVSAPPPQNPVTYPSHVPATPLSPKPQSFSPPANQANKAPAKRGPAKIAPQPTKAIQEYEDDDEMEYEDSRPKKRPTARLQQENSSPVFYIIVGLLVVIGIWLFSSKKAPPIDTNRPVNTIWNNTKSYDELMKEFEQRKQKIGSRNFQMAQENFIRGFRDFRQGNYSRAREAFQVVINLDAENEMAIRYSQLAKIKFDELVKFHLLQGSRYREKKNWRLCRSSYFNALTMLANSQSDPSFAEAKRFHDECDLALQGRY